MTNLTLQEKKALEEVFLCFQIEDRWYKRKLYNKKLVIYKLLRFVAKSRNTLYQIKTHYRR